MAKPRVFIASSTEGLSIAEAIFAAIEHETMPKLWTNQVFLPGEYPLEVLESEIKKTRFAILVASPDDQIIKRGAAHPAMRDNLLLEFGLFAGGLGRRRAFFVCPSSPRVELPSDLFGVITATYDSDRVSGGIDDRAAAVQTACQQIKSVILEEWKRILKQESEMIARVRSSEESQTVRRLYAVATKLRDALMTVQRDAFSSLSDRGAFEDVKRRAAKEVTSITESFKADALAIGVEQELLALGRVTAEALLELPFPEELSLGPSAGRQKAIGLGMEAFGIFTRGGDPMAHLENAAAQEAGSRLSSLSHRYSNWWDEYGPKLQSATSALQDRLFDAIMQLSSTYLEPERADSAAV